MKFILASESERRKEILTKAGFLYETISANCDETISEKTLAFDKPLLLSKRKALSALKIINTSEHFVILAADTMIIFNDTAFGKPKNKTEAHDFLRAFSAKKHSVVTGVSLFDSSGKLLDERSVETKVEFAPMSDSEIEWLLSFGEWKDAAGAYKIQGKAGIFIRSIEGSYENVVGLPISEVYDMLKKQSIYPCSFFG